MNRRSTYGLSSVKISTAFAAKKQSSSYFVREKRDCRRSITSYAHTMANFVQNHQESKDSQSHLVREKPHEFINGTCGYIEHSRVVAWTF